MWRLRRKYPDIPEAGVEQSWTMYQGEYDGKPLIARANAGLKPFAGHPSYSHQVGVAVPFHNPGENGFPTPEESRELGQIEEQICAERRQGTSPFL